MTPAYGLVSTLWLCIDRPILVATHFGDYDELHRTPINDFEITFAVRIVA